MAVESQSSPIKVMRKGTRSCRECRRRKLKCTWSETKSSICLPCAKHGRDCLSQGIVQTGDYKVTKQATPIEYQIKVIPFTPIVGRLAQQRRVRSVLPDPCENHPDNLDVLQAEIHQLRKLDLNAEDASPILNLFNNDIVTQVTRPVKSTLEVLETIDFGSSVSDLEKLQSVIADEPNILDVLDISADWWLSWRGQQWATRNGAVPESLRTFVTSMLEDTDPIAYAVGLLCLASSLQQLRPGKDDLTLNLANSPSTLLSRITVAVDQVVLDVYVCNPNCMLPLLQRAKIHAEGNQLRKSWSRIRQSILLAQHSRLAAPDSGLSSEDIKQRQQWVGGILEMDRFLSMVMGFPHAVDENFKKDLALSVLHDCKSEIPLRMRALRRVLAIMAGEINDRNSKMETKTSVHVAESIQQELDLAAGAMPVDWWTPETHIQNINTREGHEALMTIFWFWNVQSFLQLPLMLAIGHDSEREKNSDLCLKACSKMLKVFCMIRNTPAQAILLCSCEDFQALINTCVLMIGLLLRSSSAVPLSTQDFDKYLDMLSIVKDVFRYRAGQQGGTISKKGLSVMETLESFLTGGGNMSNAKESQSVILPYFGMIQICSTVARTRSANNEPLQVSKHIETLDLSTETLLGSSIDNLNFGAVGVEVDSTSNVQDIDWKEWDQFMYGSELEKDWIIE